MLAENRGSGLEAADGASFTTGEEGWQGGRVGEGRVVGRENGVGGWQIPK